MDADFFVWKLRLNTKNIKIKCRNKPKKKHRLFLFAIQKSFNIL